MKNGKFLNENFLEYRIDKADGSLSDDEISLYFERDTGNTILDNKVFLTFKEWNELLKYNGTASYNDQLNSLLYNCVEIVFSSSSLDCASLSNSLSKSYQQANIKIKKSVSEYVLDNNEIILNQNSSMFSGVGQILLYHVNGNEKTLKGKFFLAINSISRIKIDYYFKNTSSGVTAYLRCKNKGCKVPLVLMENSNRLPCLANDKANALNEVKIADFTSSNDCVLSFDLPSNKKESYYALGFKEEIDEKYYLLNLLYEDKFDVLNVPNTESKKSVYTCPYCGAKMRDRNLLLAYEEGAVSCSVNDSILPLPKIYDKDGNRLKRTIFCLKDLEEKDKRLVFNPSFLRVLPEEFYDHKECKIALLGSTRAGKTTFLSRFFGLSIVSDQVLMNVRYISNAMSKFGVSLTAAKSSALQAKEIGSYQVLDYNYYANTPFYKERAIDVMTGTFPMATPSGVDCSRYPFVLDVQARNCDKVYVNFYDIPGEDARNKEFKAFINGECSGIFVFINAIKDVEGNAAIINSIKHANLPKDTPIAIILAKSDLIVDKFQSSAHVLRTDYYDIDPNLPYEKGIGRDILCASMEVKSYLQSESLILDLEKQYSNVMYFSLSAFQFSDSISQENENYNDPGRMAFEDSPKRIELPFLWMLKQFGFYK